MLGAVFCKGQVQMSQRKWEAKRSHTQAFTSLNVRKFSGSCISQSRGDRFAPSMLIKHLSTATAITTGRCGHTETAGFQTRGLMSPNSTVLTFPSETLHSASCTEEPVITGSTVMKSLSPNTPTLVTVRHCGCYCARDRLLNVLGSSLAL